jgi:hypothetical protein
VDLDILQEQVPDRRTRARNIGKQPLVIAGDPVDEKVADLVIVTVQVAGEGSAVPDRFPASPRVVGGDIQVDVGAQLEIDVRGDKIAHLVQLRRRHDDVRVALRPSTITRKTIRQAWGKKKR